MGDQPGHPGRSWMEHTLLPVTNHPRAGHARRRTVTWVLRHQEGTWSEGIIRSHHEPVPPDRWVLGTQAICRLKSLATSGHWPRRRDVACAPSRAEALLGVYRRSHSDRSTEKKVPPRRHAEPLRTPSGKLATEWITSSPRTRTSPAFSLVPPACSRPPGAPAKERVVLLAAVHPDHSPHPMFVGVKGHSRGASALADTVAR